MKSFCDYLGLSNSCSYDVDDVIGRADRFGFQNFCSPDQKILSGSRLRMSFLVKKNFFDEFSIYKPT